MLKVSQLRQYTNTVKDAISEINSAYLVVSKDELMKFLQDHNSEQNTMMLSVVPEHDMAGSQDNARWQNTLGFYFLEKTDYSEYDHDGFLSIFERTQAVAEKFVHKLLTDKCDNTGLFCGFLAWLEEDSFTATPVKMLNGCNGYYIQLAMKSNI